MKTLISSLAIGLLILSGAASAGDHGKGHGKGHGKHSYSSGYSSYDYAQVVDVQPIYREVEVSRPQRECWDEPVYRHEQRRGHGHHASSGDMLAGGIIGGIIGHQIGKGHNRGISTAVGTLIGAQIGKNAAADRGRSHRQPTLAGYREHCEIRHRVSYERVIDAYAVTYRYHGESHRIEMPYDPGKRIKMRVQATPVL